LKYFGRQPNLRLIIASTAVVSFAGFNFRVLIPVLTSKTLHAGPGTLGILFGCFGLGALAGALTSASVERPRWRRVVAGVAGMGLAMVGLALVPFVWTAAGFLF